MRATISTLILALLQSFSRGAPPETQPNPKTDKPVQEHLALIECERQVPACPEHAALLHALAAQLRAAHQYEQALPMYRRAVEAAQKTFGTNDPQVASRMNGLALMQRDLRDYNGAMATAKQALTILSAKKLDQTAAASDSLLVLGTTQQLTGNLTEARVTLERAVSIRMKLHGPHDPRVAEAWSSLGFVHLQDGNRNRAETLYRSALAVLDIRDPQGELPVVLNNLARLMVERGRWAEAVKFYRAAIARWELLLGRDHPTVAAGLTNLAALLAQHHVESEADNLLQRALLISTKRLAPNDVEIGRELATLASLRATQGNAPEAGELYAKALPILVSAWGDNSQQLLPWLDGYAKFLRGQQDYGEAERVRLHATRIRVINTLHGGR